MNNNNRIYEEAECVVCTEKAVEVLLLPCRHACVCTACSKLLVTRKAPCPLCRTPIAAMTKLDESEVKPAVVMAEEVKKYMLTRDEFIKKFNLRVAKERYDLVIKASNVEHYYVNRKIADDVFEYYLGTTSYSRNMKTKMEMVGATFTGTPEKMKRLAAGESIENLMEPGYSRLVFTDFFRSVTDNVVPAEKLCKHLIDHYFQDYLMSKMDK